MNKSELLQWLQQQHRQWETLLEQIGPERMDQPGVNGAWSMKDMVAHLTGWNRRLVAYMQAAQAGHREPPPPWPAELQTDDEINDWIYRSNRGRSVAAVLRETQQVFQQLFALVEDLPDDVRIEPEWHLVWLNGERFPAGEFFDHFRDDHEQDVRNWLAKQA
jgi:hypothetical protein